MLNRSSQIQEKLNAFLKVFSLCFFVLLTQISFGQVTDNRTSVTFLENTVNTTPQLLYPSSQVSFSSGLSSFSGQTLLLEYAASNGGSVINGAVQDRLYIREEGTGPGKLNIVLGNPSSIRIGSTVIGTFPSSLTNSGINGEKLVITWNASATAFLISKVLNSITYSNSSNAPTNSRWVKLTLAGASAKFIQVLVTAENDAPNLGVTNLTNVDITTPGDPISMIPTTGSSPSSEQVPNAIDNSSTTKYLNFAGAGSGFVVTPVVGSTVVTQVNFTTANDAPDRNPTKFTLEGSNDGGTTYTTIIANANTNLSGSTNAFTPVNGPSFSNTQVYSTYRISFPTVAVSNSIMQIAEVELIGSTRQEVLYTVNGTAVVVHSLIPVTDLENNNIQSARVYIDSNFTAGDVLEWTNITGVTGSYSSSTGVLTFTGTATPANYQTLLRSVKFRTTANNVGKVRIVRFTATDVNGAQSTPVQSTIVVSFAPTLTSINNMGSAFTTRPIYVTHAAITAAAVGLGDQDPEDLPLKFKVTSLGTNGTMTLNGTSLAVGDIIDPGEQVVWTPSTTTGTVTVFSVKAFDGGLESSGTGNVQYTVSSTTPSPTVSLVGTLSAFSSCPNVGSTPQSITVNGNYLTANVTVSAPTGYEISTSQGSGFASSVTLTRSGTLVSQLVYIRLNSASSGTVTGTLTASSTGAVSQTRALTGTNTNIANATATTPQALCADLSPTVEDLTATGTNLKWYTAVSGGTPLALSANLVAGSTYYVTQTINNCESPSRVPVVVSMDNSLHFDGVNSTSTGDYVSVANGGSLFSNTTMTVEAWIKTNGASSGNDRDDIVSWGNASANVDAAEFRVNNGKIEFGIGSSWTSVTGTTSVNTNTWTHVAVVKNASAISLYVNGNLDATGTINLTKTFDRMHIGALFYNNQFYPDSYFPGNIDELRFWNTARTASQIQSTMNQTLTGSESGLTAYYNFNQGAPNTSNSGRTTLPNNAVAGTLTGTLTNFALTGLTSNWVGGISPAPAVTSPQTLCNSSAVTLANLSPSGPDIFWYNAPTGGTVLNGTTLISSGATYYAAQLTNGCISSNRSPVVPILENGISFDGTNDYVHIGQPLSTGSSYTIEAWVNQTNSTGSQNIVSTFDAPFWITSGTLYAGVGGSYTLVTSASFPTGVWTHVAVTFDDAANTMRLYRNGKLVNENTGVTQSFTQQRTHIGSHVNSSDGAVSYFNGSIDEVRIWNTVRTPSQIYANMNLDLTGVESGLVAYYDFNSGIPAGTNAGTITATNKKSGGIDGTLTGFALSGSTSNWVVGVRYGPIADDTQVECPGATIANLTATGSSVLWYSATTGGTALANSTALTIGSTYYAEQTTDGCVSSVRTPVLVTTNNALAFGASTDYVTIPDNNLLDFGTGNFTVETWVYPTNVSVRQDLINKKSGSGVLDFGIFYEPTGLIRFYTSESSGSSTIVNSTNYNLPANKWTHLAVVRDGTSHLLYINGVLNNSATGTARNLTNTNALIFGQNADNTAQFSGRLDEVRMWNTARTASEISQNLFTSFAGDESGLVAYYDFNRGVAGGTNTSVTSLTNKVFGSPAGTLTNFTLNSTTSNWVTGITPFILTQPSTLSQTLCPNQNNATELSVTASGASTLTYQWYFNTTNSNTGGTLVAGATSSTYSPSTASVSARYYYCVVSDACGQSTNSDASGLITVTAASNPTISGLSSVYLNSTIQLTATGTPATANPWVSADATKVTVSSTGLVTGVALSASAVTVTYVTTAGCSATRGITVKSFVCPTFDRRNNGNGGTCATNDSPPAGKIRSGNFNFTGSAPSLSVQEVYQNGVLYQQGSVLSSSGTIWFGNYNASSTDLCFYGNTNSDNAVPAGRWRFIFIDADNLSGTCDYSIRADGTASTLAPGSISGDQTICGNTAPTTITSVTAASGGTTPYIYQWQRSTTSATSGFTNITGANGTSYSSGTLTLTTYFMRVVTESGTGGASANTNVVTVTVTPSPAITAQPSSSAQNICQNGSVSPLAITATGAGITYQWYSNTQNSSTGGSLIAGAISNTYTPPSNTTGTRYYYCVVSGTCTPAVTSSVSGAIVISAPTVGGTLSGAATICSGTNNTTLTLTGQTGTIQRWESSLTSNFASTATITHTSTSYVASNLTTTTYYRAVVKSGGCAELVSSTVTVTVVPSSVGGTVSGTATVCSGINSTELTLSGATGSIQWQSSANNISYSNIAGATSVTYTASNLTATTYYRAVVSSGSCTSANSTVATLTVQSPSVGGSISGGSTVCTGTNTTTLTLSGYTGSIVKWQSSTTSSSSGFSDIANTSNTYTVSGLTTTTYYRAVVQNGVCAADNSSAGTITVTAAPVAGTVTSTTTSVCAGANAATLTLTGSSGTIQWQSSSNNTVFTDIAGASAATYTATNLPATTYFRAKVSNGACTALFSGSISVTVTSVPNANFSYSSSSFCPAGTASATSQTSGGTYTSTTGLSLNTTNGEIDLSNSTPGTYTVTYTVTDGPSCTNAASRVVTILAGPTSPTVDAGNVTPTICSGQNLSLTASAQTAGSITGYEWYKDASLISGAVSTTYTAITAGGYSIKAIDANGCVSPMSGTLTVTVNAISQVTITQGSLISFAGNCTSTSNSIELTASTGAFTPTYQWYLNGGAISQATASTYSLTGTAVGEYYVEVTDANTCVSRSAITKVISSQATITASELNICQGEVATLTGSSNGITSPTYRWEYLSASTWTPTGFTASTYTTTVAGQYQLVVTEAGSATNTTTSCPVTVTVNDLPVISSITPNTTICAGGQATLSVTTGTTTPTYQWYIDNVSLSAATSSSTMATQAGAYTARVTDANGCVGTSSATTLTVAARPSAPSGGQGATICGTTTATVSFSQPTGMVYNWYSDMTGGSALNASASSSYASTVSTTTTYYAASATLSGTCESFTRTPVTIIVSAPPMASFSYAQSSYCAAGTATATIIGQTGGTFSAANGLALNGNTGDIDLSASTSGTYTVTYTFSNGDCFNTTTTNVTISDNVAPVITAGGSINICQGSSVTLSSTNAATYQWYLDGVAINSGGTAATYTATAGGAYKVVVSNTGCSGSVESNVIFVTLNSAPVVSATSNAVICSGASTTLTASGASTYSWSPSTGLSATNTASVTASPITTTTYTVTGTASNGCTATATSLVTVNALPVVSAITGTASCNLGATSQLANATANGVWSSSNSNIASVNQSGLVSGLTSGSATISYNVTDANGCSGTSTVSFAVGSSAMTVSGTLTTFTACSGTPSVSQTFTISGNSLSEDIVVDAPNGYEVSTDNTNFSASLTLAQVNGAVANTTIYVRLTSTASNGASGNIVCSSTGAPSVNISTGTATVNSVPAIGSQPISDAVCIGLGTNFSLTAAGTNITYQWQVSTNAGANWTNITNGGVYSGATTSVLTLASTITETYSGYQYRAIVSGTCSPSATSNVATLTVNSIPVLTTVINQAAANGNQLSEVVFSASVSNSTFDWANSNTDIGLAASGTGNIAAFTVSNTTTAPITATITVTPTASGCIGSSGTFTITVNPTATLDAVSDQVVSAGGSTTAVNFTTSNTGGTTTYAWTNDTPGIGLTASGTGNIAAFTVSNTTTAPITATITVTPTYTNGGISTAGTPRTFTITVNPTATLNAISNQVVTAGGLTTAVNFTTSNTGGTTTYAWTNDTPGIGLAASGTGSIAAFTVSNTTTAPITATITVTPTYTNGGISTAGTPRTFTVTVNPSPSMNSVSNQVVAAGASTTAVTFSTVNTGGTTTYAWTNDTPGIGLAASGTGNIAAFTVSNTTTAPITATITVTPTYTNGGISTAGTPRTFTITVNPTGSVNAISNQVVTAGGSTTAVNFTTSNTGGTTTYAWTNSNTAIGLAASGTGNIAAFTVSNTTTAPITATITVTPTYTNAGISTAGTPRTFTITVNPSPSMNSVSNQVVAAGASTTAVTFSTVNTGGTTTYAWANSNTAIGLAASGTGNIAAFTVSNTTTAPITATITVTPTYTNGGTSTAGTPRTFTITVNPTGSVNAISNQVVTAGGSTTAVNFTTSNTGGTTTYAWTNDTPGIGLAASGTGNIAAFTVSNTTTAPITATITVTPTYTNGGISTAGTQRTFTITVNPTGSVNAISNQVVTAGGSTTAVIFTTSNTGGTTTYAWTNDTPGIGLAASGTGNIAAFTVSNTTTAPITATITVTPTYTNGGISTAGTPRTFTITVNPTGSVNAISNQVVTAGGSTTAVSFTTSNTGGTTTYAWANSNTAIGLAASGTGSIAAFTVSNTTTAPITATITVTPTYTNGGISTAGTPRTFTITVNPTGSVNAISNQILCNGSTTTAVAFGTASTGGTTTYAWTNDTPSIGLAASGTGNIAAFTVSNTTTAPITATITVTPTYTNGGISTAGTSRTFTITVNPTPTMAALQNQVVCNGSPTTAVSFSSSASGGAVTYNWINNTPSIGLAANGTGDFASFTAINTTPNPITAIITVNPVFTNGGTGCSGSARLMALTVNPTVIANPIENQAVCVGGTTSAVNFSTQTTEGTVTYAWVNDTPGIGLAATGTGNIAAFTVSNTTTAVITATITVTPTFVNRGVTCTGAPRTFTIAVNPIPSLSTVSNQVLCNGATSAAVNFASTATGGTLTYSWTNSNPGIGLSATGAGNIAAFTVSNTTTAPISATITVIPSLTNGGTTCTGAAGTFAITVNPTATVNVVNNQVVCNGATTAAVNFATTLTGGTTTYSWINDNDAIGLAASGTGSIAAFTASNTTTAPITATITVTPIYTAGTVSCTGVSRTFTITVNPTAAVSAVGNQVVCNGATTAAVNFASTASGGVVTYSWTNSAASIGLVASGTGNIAAFSAVNNGTAPVVATINVRPTFTNGDVSCLGTASAFTITVNPTATMNTVANRVFCNGANTAAINFATNNTVGTTTYSWINDNTAIGLDASGTGNIGAFSAVNTGTAPVVATITVTPTFTNGGVSCEGTPRTFTITINPTAVAGAVSNQLLCSGSATTPVNFTSNITSGTVSYGWTNSTPAIGLAASGTGNIAAFSATNNGTAPLVATITVTPSVTTGTTTCAGTPSTFTITVNPVGVVNAISNQVICNTASSSAVSFATTATAGTTTYSWTNSNTAIGLAASGTGNIASFTGVNSGSAPAVATIVVTPTLTSGGISCVGPVRSFTITVNPTATVNAVSNVAICNGATTSGISFTSSNTGGTVTYSWTNNNTAIGLAASGTGNIASFVARNATADPIVATITVTPSFTLGTATCVGTPRTFTITVNPTPVVSATDLFNRRICVSDQPFALVGTPSGGVWSGTGVSGGLLNPGNLAAGGSYVLTYSFTSAAGCSASDTTSVNAFLCEERYRMLEEGGVNIYPNPTTGRFNVQVTSTRFENMEMAVYAADGRFVSLKRWPKVVFGQVFPIDLSYLPSGVYFIKVRAANIYQPSSFEVGGFKLSIVR